MFIPMWLLVLIGVVVLSLFGGTAFWRGAWDMVSELFILSLLVSIPACVYFSYRDDTQSIMIASLPWMALFAWGVWSASVEGIKTSFWLHEMRVRGASSPEAVEKLRRGFAEALGLGPTMWQFREDVNHFPSRYAKTNTDGKPWASNVIRKDEIAEIKGPDQAHALGLDPTVLKQDQPHVIYSFSAGATHYAFCTREIFESYGLGDDDDDEGYLRRECGVWIVEKPARVVLAMRLSYKSHIYAGHTLSSTYVEAFRPGAWVPTLLSIVDRVRQDESEKYERLRKELDRDKANRNFV